MTQTIRSELRLMEQSIRQGKLWHVCIMIND